MLISAQNFVHPYSWMSRPLLSYPLTENLHNFAEDSSANRDMKIREYANTFIFIKQRERSLVKDDSVCKRFYEKK
jgi:hypothetical protein